MITAQAVSPSGPLPEQTIRETLTTGLSGQYRGAKLLVLVPDETRTFPLPRLFRLLVDTLAEARQLDFMVALGTHPPPDEAALNRLFGITQQERTTTYRHIGISCHAWDNPAGLASLGVMEKDEIHSLSGEDWHTSLPERVEVQLNKAVLEYDQVIILGPVFPHEIVGMSGGAKYLFPGISGAEMIHATHWLGALRGVMDTIGFKDTPVRRMIAAAAARLKTPLTLIACVVAADDLVGVFVGDLQEAWDAAAELSIEHNVIWSDQPYPRVLSCAPAMYGELWTAAKAMYKLEPVVAPGGELILYAPHLDTISQVHGSTILEIGYHTLAYFLNDWQRFKDYPLAVLAHSTHLRGTGSVENGVEKARIQVTLASKIPAEVCARLNLGYRNPAELNPRDFQHREQDGVLYVPHAGEVLYRLSGKGGVKSLS
jgi:nickel-dependent lactate racemase